MRHLTMCGYFYRDTNIHAYIKAYGEENPSAPGTHSIIVDGHGLPAEPHPDGYTPRMIVDVSLLLHAQMPDWWDRVDAVYVAVENNPLGLTRMVGLAKDLMDRLNLPRRPVLTYSGRSVYPTALGVGDILGVQLYADRMGDPVANLRAQAAVYDTLVRSVPRIAVIGQAYDRGGWHTAEQLAAIQPVIYEIADGWPNCEGLFWFSDSRAGGTRDHEEMRPYHQAIADAISHGVQFRA